MPSTSDDAVRKATGHGWDHWFAIHDAYPDLDHTQRAKRFWQEHGDGTTVTGTPAQGSINGWWAQMITVEWEKERGKRVEGQSCAGDFQVSCSKTVPWNVDEAWERVLSTPFLKGADWTEGASWDTDGGRVEVRRADPGKMLRWFWHDGDGKSTVEVSFIAKGDKSSIVFRHHGLASAEAKEAYRGRWKDALAAIAPR